MRVLEIKNKKEYQDYFILNFLVNEKDKARALKRIHSKEKYLPLEKYEIKTFKNNHKIVDLCSYLFPFTDKKKQSIVRLIVFIDKTIEFEKQKLEIDTRIKQYENDLLKKQNQIQEKLLQEIATKKEQLLNTINNSDYLFWITDNKLNIILFNDCFYKYCKKYYKIDIKVGDNTIHLQKKMNEIEKSTEKIRNEIIQKLKQFPEEISYEISHFDEEQNKTRYFKMTFKPYIDENQKVKNYYCYGHEVTEKYEFLNQIEQQSIKLKEIIEHSPIYLWSMNHNEEITLFNSNYEHLIQTLYGEKPVIGKKLSKGKYAQNKELIETLNYHYQKAFNGSHENFKLEFDLNENKKIILDINLFPIVIQNQVREVSGIAVDITQEVEKQKQLYELLIENEILMKEVHHRIKNNLQVISSMINFQIHKEKDPHTISILQDTQNRIFSMALIHQTLYQNKNYTSINISNVFLMLVQNILYSFNQTDIQVSSEIDEVILDVNTAIPIALILNESITNIIKYAFPPNFKEKKKISIHLKRNVSDIQMIIKDNGIGLSHEKLQSIQAGLELDIIRSLSEQINAKLLISSQPNQGVEVKLLIPQL